MEGQKERRLAEDRDKKDKMEKHKELEKHKEMERRLSVERERQREKHKDEIKQHKTVGVDAGAMLVSGDLSEYDIKWKEMEKRRREKMEKDKDGCESYVLEGHGRGTSLVHSPTGDQAELVCIRDKGEVQTMSGDEEGMEDEREEAGRKRRRAEEASPRGKDKRCKGAEDTGVNNGGELSGNTYERVEEALGGMVRWVERQVRGKTVSRLQQGELIKLRKK